MGHGMTLVCVCLPLQGSIKMSRVPNICFYSVCGTFKELYTSRVWKVQLAGKTHSMCLLPCTRAGWPQQVAQMYLLPLAVSRDHLQQQEAEQQRQQQEEGGRRRRQQQMARGRQLEGEHLDAAQY